MWVIGDGSPWGWNIWDLNSKKDPAIVEIRIISILGRGNSYWNICKWETSLVCSRNRNKVSKVKVGETLIFLFWPMVQILRLIHQVPTSPWYFVFTIVTATRWLMVLFMGALTHTSFQTFIGHEAQRICHFSLQYFEEEIFLFTLSNRSHLFINMKTMEKTWFDLIWCLFFPLSFTGCFWTSHDLERSLTH